MSRADKGESGSQFGQHTWNGVVELTKGACSGTIMMPTGSSQSQRTRDDMQTLVGTNRGAAATDRASASPSFSCVTSAAVGIGWVSRCGPLKRLLLHCRTPGMWQRPESIALQYSPLCCSNIPPRTCWRYHRFCIDLWQSGKQEAGQRASRIDEPALITYRYNDDTLCRPLRE